MDAISEGVPDDEGGGAGAADLRPPVCTRQMLPPKGACWYCDKPLDSVRRFCGKTCADAFDEEVEFTR